MTKMNPLGLKSSDIHDDLPIKALSIRQPWVWAILHAGKRVENRPRRFHYRGPICLHASLYEPRLLDDAEFVKTWRKAHGYEGEFPATEITAQSKRGGIVGTAEIVDCVEQSDSPWFFGPYGLILDNVQPVPFIPVKGALGLFDWRKYL